MSLSIIYCKVVWSTETVCDDTFFPFYIRIPIPFKNKQLPNCRNTNIPDRSLSLLGTDSSIKRDGVKFIGLLFAK